jgi:hypothetical protein
MTDDDIVQSAIICFIVVSIAFLVGAFFIPPSKDEFKIRSSPSNFPIRVMFHR